MSVSSRRLVRSKGSRTMADPSTAGKLYLVERMNDDADCRYYAEHGEKGGVLDAIGYDTAPHARKFRTESGAREFIRTQLPEWGRERHRAVGLGFLDFPMEAVDFRAMLWYGIEVPDEMLEPTAGQLRIWRR